MQRMVLLVALVVLLAVLAASSESDTGVSVDVVSLEYHGGSPVVVSKCGACSESLLSTPQCDFRTGGATL